MLDKELIKNEISVFNTSLSRFLNSQKNLNELILENNPKWKNIDFHWSEYDNWYFRDDQKQHYEKGDIVKAITPEAETYLVFKNSFSFEDEDDEHFFNSDFYDNCVEFDNIAELAEFVVKELSIPPTQNTR